MLIQEVVTPLSPGEVLDRAREFFEVRFTPYAGFVAEESPTHLVFRFDAGELMLAAIEQEEGTLVRGSTSRVHHELSQFLTTLAPAEEVRQNLPGPGVSGAG